MKDKELLDQIANLDTILAWYDREILKMKERREEALDRWTKLMRRLHEGVYHS
jgi:hypothetical protein